jgi:hypothetical protein
MVSGLYQHDHKDPYPASVVDFYAAWAAATEQRRWTNVVGDEHDGSREANSSAPAQQEGAWVYDWPPYDDSDDDSWADWQSGGWQNIRVRKTFIDKLYVHVEDGHEFLVELRPNSWTYFRQKC